MLTGETERLASESKMSAGKVASFHKELVQKQRSELELGDKIRRLETEIEQVNQVEELCKSFGSEICCEFELHLRTRSPTK